MSKLGVLGVLLMVCFATVLEAQPTTGIESWFGVKGQQSLSKKVKLYGAFQYRFDLQQTSVKQHFFQVKPRFRLNQWLYFAPGVRFTTYPDINKNRIRYTLDLTAKIDPKGQKWKVDNRLRGQYERFINTIDQQLTVRNKLSFGYNLSKLVDPEVSYEFFWQPEELDYRIRLDLRWRLKKRLRISTFYAYEQEMLVRNKDRVHIIGVVARLRGKGTLRKKRDE